MINSHTPFSYINANYIKPDAPLTKNISVATATTGRKQISHETKEEVRLGAQRQIEGAFKILNDKRLSKKEKEEKLKDWGVKASKDMGGHGGTYRVTAKTNDGQMHQVFLKVYDQHEDNNYQLIDKHAPELTKHMPVNYGKVSAAGRDFLVMTNTRTDHATGKGLDQIVDIKLSGVAKGKGIMGSLLSGKKNRGIIATNDEMKATRGKSKNLLDRTQMEIGAQLSPNYMVAVEPRCSRIFFYAFSKFIFKARIHRHTDINHQKLADLEKKLEVMKKDLANSGVALIGASIILVKQKDGSIEPYIIDPAHMQVKPTPPRPPRADIPNRDALKLSQTAPYTGSGKPIKGKAETEMEQFQAKEEEFKDRKESIELAMDSVIKTVNDSKNEIANNRLTLTRSYSKLSMGLASISSRMQNVKTSLVHFVLSGKMAEPKAIE